MESKNIIYLLSSAFFLLIICSCLKGDSDEAGLNEMEWRVEGELHKAKCGGPITSCSWVSCTTRPCDPVYTRFEPEYRTLAIRARNSTYIDIFIEEEVKVDSPNIIGGSDKMIISQPSPGRCSAYYIDTSMDYTFLITQLDTVERIMVGEFSFTGINECMDTMVVENGRFRLDF